MRVCSRKLLFFMAVVAVATPALTQTSPSKSSTETDKGFTEVETFQGTMNSESNLLKLDSTVGYDFNKHFGVFAGVPVYFANVKSSTTTTGTTTTTTPSSSHNGIGNAYLGFVLRAPNPALDYASAVTATAPTGSTKNGLSTGRVTVDWDNRFEHSFGRLTPFFEGGLGNTVPDSRLITRSFTSLGFVAHLEEGGQFELVKHFSIGGSAYQIVPAGNQKIFSKLVTSGSPVTGGAPVTPGGKGKPIFATTATASGSGLTRENGFNALAEFEPTPVWDLELGYTHSMTFGLDGFAFNLRMNIGKLLRARKSS
jgi:hypothetical protein